MKKYEVIAFYLFTPIPNPQEEVVLHKHFFLNRDVMCRIYISEEGFNGQMSAAEEDSKAYQEWMISRGYQTQFKIHPHHEHVFPRQTVKYRRQLVAFGVHVDVAQGGDHVSPQEWKEMLEKEDGHVVLDIRNDYEWKIGHFEGAECPPCEKSLDFHRYTEELITRIDKENTPVLMYCTGGIRCEIYSVLLKQKGVKKVFQLQGGVINYGLQEGSNHWQGKLFVFDDRLAIPLAQEEMEPIGECHHCGQAADSYYNCADMDCNALFICCPACFQKYVGCCKAECMESPHLRPFHSDMQHKPFRRKHHYSQSLGGSGSAPKSALECAPTPQ